MMSRSSSSYLKTYPYLFVKETDQTEYFCTICETYVKEEEHKNHLFEGGHKGETLSDYFVLVNGNLYDKAEEYLYICVICWGKLSSTGECKAHRELCKPNRHPVDNRILNKVRLLKPREEEVGNEEEDDKKADPKQEDNVKNSSEEDPKESEITVPTLKSSSSRRRKQTQPQQHIMYPATPPESEKLNSAKTALHQHSIIANNNCFECSLCSVLLPSTSSYIQHLKGFHRIASNVFENDSNCPLCLASISLLDLSGHLVSVHGLIPQTAGNSLILWVLTNFQKQIKYHRNIDCPEPLEEISFKEENEKEDSFPPSSILHHQLKSTKSLIGENPLIPLPPSHPLLPTQQLLAAAMLMNGGIEGIPPQTILPSHETNSTVPNTINSCKTKLSLSSIVSKFSRSHIANNKQSFQCSFCSKWFAVPPIKHMRSHILKFKQEKRKFTNLLGGQIVCLVCYNIFGSQEEASIHFQKHNAGQNCLNGVNDFGGYLEMNNGKSYSDPMPVLSTLSSCPPLSLPLSLTMTTSPLITMTEEPISPLGNIPSSPHPQPTPKGIELDNAGRVKSGKVRKQCELCGEWSNIKWFFKHMSEVHQALFCRCCREYLPIPEQEDHRRWHAEPPYMGQKIRIENGQPIIIDRKERASLTPIGSLAPWGGSSGGMVVKAIDDVAVNGMGSSTAKKRKTYGSASNISSASNSSAKMINLDPSAQIANCNNLKPGVNNINNNNNTKDTLMPKETCPVCGILITYKNLARHIKLRHKIKYKFCHKCRKLVPNSTYDAHKASHTIDRAMNNGSVNLSTINNNICSNEVSIVPLNESLPSPIVDQNKPDITSDLMELTLENSINNDSASGGGEDCIEASESVETGSVTDGRKSENFRANTSKTKLESLLGKEFKHPRRKCALCGYSVSYSNFKRHLRNAHFSEYLEVQNNPGAFKKALATLALETDDDTIDGSQPLMSDDEDDDLDDEEFDNVDEKKDFFRKVECSDCGDQILEEFLPRHMKMNHQKEESTESGAEESLTIHKAPFPPEEAYRTCPFCSIEMNDTGSLLKHCKLKHKTSVKWCDICSKYLSKKMFKAHSKSHDSESVEDEEENSLFIGTSADEEDKVEESKSNFFNCQDCNTIFLAQEAYQIHVKEKHGNNEVPSNLLNDDKTSSSS